LLSGREENEAYLAAKPGETYVVFFTDGGEVKLDLSQIDGDFTVKWFSIRQGKSSAENTVNGGEVIALKAPGELEWIALLTKQ
jgi:hypothetical protein